ncbi:MAG: glycoside hydrolase family 44 protein [Propionibacteriales bacterium]|nr:glycoside hydrolase family 44 protein [Propionibacteriales bacterium]
MRTPRFLAAAATATALALLTMPSVPAAATPVTPDGPRAGIVLPAKTTKISLSVDVAANQHPISPLIYGVNYASQTAGLSSQFTVPVDRWGGNSTSRYNYLNDTYNTGQDWYFENIVAGPGERLTDVVDSDRAHHSASLVTVPMIGWVSKDSPSEHPFNCSYPKVSFPHQNDFDYWDPDCGNGVNGSTELTADPTTTSVAANAAFSGAMVSSLVSRYGTAAAGGVGFYALDNEPVLWNSTHRDVHPDPLTADELWTKSQATATAVKNADPSAAVLGPSDWGWCAYYFSAADDCGQSTADRDAHGGLPLGAWYLQQFAAAQAGGSPRLLDYFDEHFYPQANGVALNSAGSSATKALRLRSTRALWDPSYVDESWISEANGGKPLAWIRTMKAWTAQYYPGTKTAITEYNFGGLESMNGALTQADVLGIFGREGLDLATLWGPGKASQPWAYAFKIYRNYDGHGAAFGSTSVKATTSNQGKLAIYAATKANGTVTIMVINKTGSTISSTLSLKNFSPKSKATVYRYSSASKTKIVKKSSLKVKSKKLKAAYPGSSITLLVIGRR